MSVGGTKVARAVILKSDDEVRWEPVRPEDVPEWLKEEDVMGNLVAGAMAKREGTPWFRAQVLDSSPILVDRASVAGFR